MLYEEIIKNVKLAGGMINNTAASESEIYNKEGFSNFVTDYDKKVQDFLVR